MNKIKKLFLVYDVPRPPVALHFFDIQNINKLQLETGYKQKSGLLRRLLKY